MEPNEKQTSAANEEKEETGAKEASVGRSAALMSALVIVSRLTGFLRTWSQAYALGVTVLSSCYSVANNLPNQLYEIVVGGMLVTAFLPVYLTEKEKHGVEGARRYTSNLVSIVILLMGALAILGFVFAAQVVWTQSFSANAEFDSGLATYFFRFFVIEVVLYALSSIFSGVLNAERDYFWSSAAPILNNFVTTASFLAYAFLANSNPTLALVILALGNPLGVAIQVVVQMPSLRKHGICLRPYINLRDPAIKDTLSIGIPTVVVMLCSFETTSVMTSSALSVTAAGASISYYARLWYTLPYAILAVPITTAMFTELSHYVASGDMEKYRAGVASGTSKIVFFMIPFALYLVVFAVPLVTFIAAGKFSADDIQVTSGYLQALALSLPAYGVSTYLQKVCSSLRSMELYAKSHVIAAVLQTIACFVFTPMFGLNFVALSSTLYAVVVDVATFVSLRRKLGHIGMKSVLMASAKALGLGAAGAAVGLAVVFLMGSLPGIGGTSLRGALLMLVLGGVPAVLLTYGAAVALKVPEASFVNTLLAKVRRRS